MQSLIAGNCQRIRDKIVNDRVSNVREQYDLALKAKNYALLLKGKTIRYTIVGKERGMAAVVAYVLAESRMQNAEAGAVR